MISIRLSIEYVKFLLPNLSRFPFPFLYLYNLFFPAYRLGFLHKYIPSLFLPLFFFILFIPFKLKFLSIPLNLSAPSTYMHFFLYRDATTPPSTQTSSPFSSARLRILSSILILNPTSFIIFWIFDNLHDCSLSNLLIFSVSLLFLLGHCFVGEHLWVYIGGLPSNSNFASRSISIFCIFFSSISKELVKIVIWVQCLTFFFHFCEGRERNRARRTVKVTNEGKFQI